MKNFLTYLILLILAVGCSDLQKERQRIVDLQRTCIKEMVTQDMALPEAKHFRLQLKDTFDYWVNNVEVDMIKGYQHSNYVISDKIAFNEGKNMAMGFVVRYRKEPNGYDDAQIIAGELINNEWHFYYLSYFSMQFQRRDHCDIVDGHIALECIEEEMLELHVMSSFYEEGTCKINKEYFNKKINNDVRFDHQHRFLSGTYPKYDTDNLK